MAEHATPQLDNPAVSHETSDVDLRRITYWGAGLALTVVLILAFLLWLFQLYHDRELRRGRAVKTFPQSAPVTEPPRLQISPRAEMARLRATENRILSSYAWIDQEKGVVRIPVERAMEILVERSKQKS